MKRMIRISFILLFALQILLVNTSCNKQAEKRSHMRFVSLAWQETTVATNLAIVNEWNRLHPELKVEYVQGTWNSAHDYLITAFETGDVPDIFHYESSVIVDYSMRGYLADLAPYLSEETKKDILDVAWATVRRPNGEIDGVPFLIESLVVLYNSDMFDEAGITPPTVENPWSWDDLKAAAETLTKDNNGDGITDQYGAGIGLRSSANIIMNTSLSFGGSFFEKENDWFVPKINVEAKQLLQRLLDMIYKDKSVAPASIGESGAGMIPGFLSGKYAMIVLIGSWARQQIVENAPAGFRWGVMPPLKAKNQNYSVSTQTLSVPAKSPYIKEAVKFIEFMLSSENTARLALNDWMIPARRSCLEMPEFKDSVSGWDITCSSVQTLGVGPWLGMPGYVEWKTRVMNPVMQEMFAGRLNVKEAVDRIERESKIVLNRYRKRGEVW
ncbi:MAG: sugar ABC transporter substrate-binding protein [Ignavibacteriaceae bacterium]|nr:sugar ABC transporter substrate-binding protein [Ignavibacteriaceae bacterium]